jgi:predicted glycoside hydrolase/deacetylase ChbG (UPF0249 family)
LIVNADDFGLTPGVNRAIRELHQAGLLTSVTLIARALATEDAVKIGLGEPSLGVGCHVVLVDGEPVLSQRNEIPHLADPVDLRFKATPGELIRMLYGRWPLKADGLAREIELETAAQIRLLQNSGIRLTHIDTHKHTHMFPAVLRPVLRAAKAAGIRAVRNPFEPMWSVRATAGAPWIRRAEVALLRRSLEARFKRIVAEEGFATPDGAIGILATGTLDKATLGKLLENMPEGTWELVTHPGYRDHALDEVKTRLRASREIEREALQVLNRFAGLDLITFADLAATLPRR